MDIGGGGPSNCHPFPLSQFCYADVWIGLDIVPRIPSFVSNPYCCCCRPFERMAKYIYIYGYIFQIYLDSYVIRHYGDIN